MYKRSFVVLAILASTLLIHQSSAQVVCSQDELIKELYEDLIDNGSFN